MIKGKYGVVYTPDSLSIFVASLLKRLADKKQIKKILDPACGECALLGATKRVFGDGIDFIGIDVDNNAVKNTKNSFHIIHNDTIMPRNVKKRSSDYWREKIPNVDIVIANPPWSSEKVYDKSALSSAGFSLVSGQYDSYVLFIELAYNILPENGLMAFIIPDSLFDSQNVFLRKFLLDRTRIKIIARLGEKIFSNINRATTIIICEKANPKEDSETTCFRLSTEDRKLFLAGNETLLTFFDKKSHNVLQKRFLYNNDYNFDIDTHSNEEVLLKKIEAKTIEWNKVFIFGRGVEISKNGKVVYCPHCNYAQGYTKKQIKDGEKLCINCGEKILVTEDSVRNIITQEPIIGNHLIYVGENIQRYKIVGNYYIHPNIRGINYKNKELYNPPKILIRKTGLGIYSSIDYTGNMTSQTVYILKYADPCNQIPLEYYLALINSRVVYYYYIKVYGENEWKSHPYLTKQIIFTLPIKPFIGNKTDLEIIRIAKGLARCYDYKSDIELEKLIMKKYNLTKNERLLILNEMNNLPNLSTIKNMKIEV